MQGAAELIDEARAAMAGAYAPYSGLRVGAALRARDGRIFHGANIENASYGLSICAERVVTSCAVTAQVREFEMLALACSSGDTCTPCGACRQFLAEFAPDLVIVSSGAEGEVLTRSLSDLLPEPFRL